MGSFVSVSFNKAPIPDSEARRLPSVVTFTGLVSAIAWFRYPGDGVRRHAKCQPIAWKSNRS
jgi:hypothetical protein